MENHVSAPTQPTLPVFGKLRPVVQALQAVMPNAQLLVGGSYMLYANGLTEETPEDIDIIVLNPGKEAVTLLQSLEPFAVHTSRYTDLNDTYQIKLVDHSTNSKLNLLIYTNEEVLPIEIATYVMIDGLLLRSSKSSLAFRAWHSYAKTINGAQVYRKKDVDKSKAISKLLLPIDAQWQKQ